MESKRGSDESREVRQREDGNHEWSSPHDGPQGQSLNRRLSSAILSPGASAAGGVANGWSYEDDEPENYEKEFRGAGREKETLKSLHYEIQKGEKELQKVKKDITSLLKNVNDLMNTQKALALFHDKQEWQFQEILAYLKGDERKVRSLTNKLNLPFNVNINYEKLKKKMQELERSLTSIYQFQQQMTERLEDLETPHSGTFLWKIANYAEKKRDAMSTNVKSIYSPPFFTSQYGYKLCGRVFLMGNGVGKGTHISLFLTIMRGPFDAVLPWPFKERITFQLVNQDDPINKSIVEAFRPDSASSSFKRPTTEKNIGAGCPLFAKIQMIEDPKSGFVRDNTIYLKIVSQTSDIPEIK